MPSPEDTSAPPSISSRPKVSVITPSLNHGRFLRDTIESVLTQSYPNVEHVIADGGSTDETVPILKEYGSRIRWVSERETDENPILEAYRKAFALSTGDYIIQCCVSDAFMNRNWFRMCVDALEADPEISVVWGLDQYMSEDGNLGRVVPPEFVEKPAPQKRDFLPLWFAHGTCVPEPNYCIRRAVFDACFPERNSNDPMSYNPTHTFNYRFNTLGYLPWFLPVVANYCRGHGGQRGVQLREKETQVHRCYLDAVKRYEKDVLRGRVRHQFRDGRSRVIGEVGPGDLPALKKTIFTFRLKHSLRKKLQRIINRL
jgi:glycosyltransferase involved in cell wall biosynthesis